ncbi:PKD domain-containing protein [bacterium]|nr:PKD domain-containing protein [bacterium]
MSGIDGKSSVGNRVIVFGVTLLAFSVSALVFALSCNSSKPGTIPGSPVNAESAGDEKGMDGWQPPESAVARTVTIEQAIADAKAFEPPAEVAADPDFDPGVFEMLRDEFIRQMEASKLDRLTSAAPFGDAGRVTDLTYDPDAGLLNWSYVNIGDYDSSGEVGIPDITMIAQNYLAKTNDGIGNDALEAWIDGDKSGEVGISDITPIAQGYLAAVMNYRILTSDSETGEFSPIGELVPFGDLGIFPKTFSVALPAGALTWIAIEPVGTEGGVGERGAFLLNSPPSILSVSPIAGLTGNEVQFSVCAAGTMPFTYSWDFGGGAFPSTSSEPSPIVTLGEPDSYYASLNISNIYGSYSFDFILTVSPLPTAPVIAGVSPQSGAHGAEVDFVATVSGTPPLSFEWHFGGGATPDSSVLESPSVTLGNPGTYNASLLVLNGYGNSSYDFVLSVVPWHIDVIDTSERSCGYPSVAFDSQNRPHISYINYKQYSCTINYADYSGFVWNVSSIDTSGMGGNTGIAIDSNDLPYIAYRHWVPYESELRCAYYNGTKWFIETVDADGFCGMNASIAIDSLDVPHISYQNDIYSSNSLAYATVIDSKWDCKRIASAAEIICKYVTEIAIDDSNMPHISYYTYEDLMYARFSGTTWNIESIDSVGNGGVQSAAICIDPANRPHVCYGVSGDDPFTSGLKYAYFNGSMWIYSTIEQVRFENADIALDSYGKPHISYCGVDGIKYAHLEESEWVIATIDGCAQGSSSIAIDSSDRAFISYVDYNSNSLKGAWME